MNLVLKTSLKNIFGKPLRTLLVVFSIFVCSICAMVCFDFASGIENLLGSAALGLSKTDFLFATTEYIVRGLPDGMPECEILEINANSETLYKDIEGEYNYVTTEKLSVYGVNIETAIYMEFIDPIELDMYETVVTSRFADKYGYSVGDTLIVHDRTGNEVELKIVDLMTGSSKNYFMSNYTAIVNEETGKIISCGRSGATLVLIDVLNNEEVSSAVKLIEDYYPNAALINFAADEEMTAFLNEIVMYFYLIFAIAFLLVIFVTTSICNRIVSERMPFIGTLRSLGMSNARTARILLLENALYAILGSVPAVAVYALLRVPVLEMFSISSSRSDFKSDIPPMSAVVVAGVILGAVLIECLIPLRAILKALKTSIRDIIFDNRDTAYKFSKAGLVIGLVFTAGALVSVFFSKVIAGAICCLVCSVTALALLFPWIFRGVTTLIRNISEKKENAGWSLASVEAVSRKSTVGSGVLCVTAAAMSVIVFSFAQSALLSIGTIYFDSDVVVTCSKSMKSYMFVDDLESVTDTEAVYAVDYSVTINDEEESGSGTFYALPEGGYKYYSAFEGLPDTMEDGSILVEETYAEDNGLAAGDELKITYNPDGVLPIVRTYKIASVFKQKSLGISRTFFISERDYKEIFKDKPGYLLIRCDDPDRVSRLISTYAAGAYSDVKTHAELVQEMEADDAKVKAVTIGIIVVAVGMTFIGMVSNQLIGFEGRKKECAVMLSTAMGKDKLSGILFREMLITSFTASSFGTVIGILMTAVINLATSNSSVMELEVEINPVLTLLFFIFLVIAFTGTVLFPIKHLGKMKIAEQIKYE